MLFCICNHPRNNFVDCSINQIFTRYKKGTDYGEEHKKERTTNHPHY